MGVGILRRSLLDSHFTPVKERANDPLNDMSSLQHMLLDLFHRDVQ
jgi:hypothetical protein